MEFNLENEERNRPGYPLLVTGLPGVPGYNAFHFFRKSLGESVIGLCPPSSPRQRHPGTVFAEAFDSAALENLFNTHRFRAVIDASGWCALKPCEYDPEKARLLNFTAGVNIARICAERDARLIRVSTDLVFDGSPRLEAGGLLEGGYREDTPVSPVTVYGKIMAEAETAILSEHPTAAILRIALPMGPSFSGHAGAIDWIDSRFRNGRPATLYYDEVRSNLYVQDFHRVLTFFLQTDLSGIFHVGGDMPLSLFEIAQVINRVGGYDPALLQGCLRHEAGPMPPRAGNVSMDCGKLRAVLPAGMPGRWPREKLHIPDSRNWHAEGRSPNLGSGLIRYLYGYGSKTHDLSPSLHPLHPLTFIPGLSDALSPLPLAY